MTLTLLQISIQKGGGTLIQDISIEELRSVNQTEKWNLIDVRSPSEYQNATIPGSINIPFFNDTEKEEKWELYINRLAHR